jgi:hypothetical protein
MSLKIQSHELVEENISISSKEKKKLNQDQSKEKNKNNIDYKSLDDNNIILPYFRKNKDSDDNSMNSAAYSAQELTSEYKKEKASEKKKEKAKTERLKKHYSLYKEKSDRYEERMKERTMRQEVDKIFQETERLKSQYEEKKSYIHFFDNNPQFQKLIHSIWCKLLIIFIHGLFIFLMNELAIWIILKKREGINIASLVISMAQESIVIVLMLSLKVGLLNDPYLSKTFRWFIIFEFFLIITSFVLNILTPFLIMDNLEENKNGNAKKIIIIQYVIIGLTFIGLIKYIYNLFFESVLILFKKKTEYSILMINEQNSKKEPIIDMDISRNATTDDLKTYTTEGLIEENKKKLKSEQNLKEEENFKNINYFNKFHISITSNRKDDGYFFKKKPY